MMPTLCLGSTTSPGQHQIPWAAPQPYPGQHHILQIAHSVALVDFALHFRVGDGHHLQALAA